MALFIFFFVASPSTFGFEILPNIMSLASVALEGAVESTERDLAGLHFVAFSEVKSFVDSLCYRTQKYHISI